MAIAINPYTNPVGPALQQMLGGLAFQREIPALQQYLQNPMGQPPMLWSPQGQALLAHGLQSQIMTPVDKAMAQSHLMRAQAALRPTMEQIRLQTALQAGEPGSPEFEAIAQAPATDGIVSHA